MILLNACLPVDYRRAPHSGCDSQSLSRVSVAPGSPPALHAAAPRSSVAFVAGADGLFSAFGACDRSAGVSLQRSPELERGQVVDACGGGLRARAGLDKRSHLW